MELWAAFDGSIVSTCHRGIKRLLKRNSAPLISLAKIVGSGVCKSRYCAQRIGHSSQFYREQMHLTVLQQNLTAESAKHRIKPSFPALWRIGFLCVFVAIWSTGGTLTVFGMPLLRCFFFPSGLCAYIETAVNGHWGNFWISGDLQNPVSSVTRFSALKHHPPGLE